MDFSSVLQNVKMKTVNGRRVVVTIVRRMMSTKTVLEGTYIVFTDGAYSDFSVVGLYQAKSTFEYETQIWTRPMCSDMDVKTFHWMVKKGTLEKIEYEEIWCDVEN